MRLFLFFRFPFFFQNGRMQFFLKIVNLDPSEFTVTLTLVQHFTRHHRIHADLDQILIDDDRRIFPDLAQGITELLLPEQMPALVGKL